MKANLTSIHSSFLVLIAFYLAISVFPCTVRADVAAGSPEENKDLASGAPVSTPTPAVSTPPVTIPPTTTYPWTNKTCTDPATQVLCGNDTATPQNPFEIICTDYNQIKVHDVWANGELITAWIPWTDGMSTVLAVVNGLTENDSTNYQYDTVNAWWSENNYAFDGVTAWDHEGDPNLVAHCIKAGSDVADPVVCGCGRFTATGCFPPGVRITLSNGLTKAVEDLAAGDMLWNPIRQQPVAVKRIIEGPEAEPLIEFGYNGGLVRVSQKHPVMVSPEGTDGMQRSAYQAASLKALAPGQKPGWNPVQASAIKIGDVIQGSDGKLHPISYIKSLPVEEGQIVVNFEVDTPSLEPEDHAVLSDGVVTGDFTLQLLIGRQGAAIH